MAVLVANRSLGLRRRTAAGVDGHGDPVGFTWGAMAGPWPGRAEELPDAEMGGVGGRTWVLALDPAAWPVQQGDMAVDPATSQEWLVTSADLLRNNADPSVDYIRVEAHARVGGTRP